jgi:hypothetical protein
MTSSPIVKVARFRDETDHLFRLANVDYHACVGVREIECWKQTATRILEAASTLRCLRATDFDRQQLVNAVAAMQSQLIAADVRIAQLQSASKPQMMKPDEIDSKLCRIALTSEDGDADRVTPTPLALSQHLRRGWVVRINGDDVSICEIDAEFITTVPYIENDELLDQRPGSVRHTMGWRSVRELHIY